MAGIGMLHMVAAPLTSHTDGSAPTYGNGFLIGPAVEGNITFNVNDNPDCGDDVVIDNDNGVNGYSGTMENNYLDETVAKALYGWETNSSSENVITDKAAPYHGFGYIKKVLNKGVLKFRAFWYLKSQWTIGSYANAKTKQRNGVEWQHDVSNITGEGIYVDSSGYAHFVIPKTFDTYSAAETWLDGKANYLTATST